MSIQLSEHFDYKKILKFTCPSIIMMIFTSLYGIVDGIFVSNIAGSEAFAAINLIWPIIMILGAVGFMVGTGGSALVSKTIGEGDRKKANEYFSLLVYFVIIVGFILTVLGIIFMRPIAKAVGAEGTLQDNCVIYGVVILVTLIPFMLQNCFQSFLVAAEKPHMGLIISIFAGVTNMVLDFVFIYVFHQGLFGAAVATSISQVVGGIIPLVYFWRENDSLLKLGKTKFDAKALLKTCTNGSSEMLSNISMSLVNVLYNIQLMKIVGSDGVVAYGIIMYISFTFVAAFLGYSIGSAPIISYHYGAKNTDELKNLFVKSLVLIVIGAFSMTFLAEILAKQLSGIFVSYSESLMDMTINAIRLYSISFLFAGFNIFGSAFFTALNNGLVSAEISFIRTILQVIAIFVLPIFLKLDGIWLAVVVSEFAAFLITTGLLIANRKKYKYM